MEKIINLVAISVGKYPNNSASNIRHLLTLKGLAENNINAQLISIYAEGQNINKNIIIDNVNITTLSINSQSNIFFKFIAFIRGFLKLFFKIIKLKIDNKIDVLLLYCVDIEIVLPVFLFCKLLGITIVHERTEYPYIKQGDNIAFRIKKMIYLKIIIPRIDGLFVISNSLKDFFSKYYHKEIQIIPIIVDKERFLQTQSSIYDFKYFVYCGNIGIYKDGVDVMVESFAKISNKYPSIKLILIGNNKQNKDVLILDEIIKKHQIEDKVIFTGELPIDKIPSILNNSIGLLLSRPDNIQAKYGLPTKLGEYLMTGKPVVVTSVGDIPVYLIDNKSAFIAVPDSTDSYANKLELLLNDYEKALIIADNGRKVCEKHFNYNNQSKKLTNYIKKIKLRNTI